jgi:glutaredoxin-like protein NrdH
MPEITVYSQPNCMPCRATVRKLNALGAEYTKVDVSQDDTALNYILDLGYQQTPVVVAGDEHWSGYSPDRIEQAVRRINEEQQ